LYNRGSLLPPLTPPSPPPVNTFENTPDENTSAPPHPDLGYTPAAPPPASTMPGDTSEVYNSGEDDEEENEYGLTLPDYNPLLD
jgi:hypothetical protein